MEVPRGGGEGGGRDIESLRSLAPAGGSPEPLPVLRLPDPRRAGVTVPCTFGMGILTYFWSTGKFQIPDFPSFWVELRSCSFLLNDNIFVFHIGQKRLVAM